MKPFIANKARQIKLLICDVDGVLTDGGLYFDQSGHQLKRFSVLDGFGMKRLPKYGIQIAIISTHDTPAIRHRMQGLGIKHCHLGIRDKSGVFDQLLSQFNLSPDKVAYIGDDWVDLPVMTRVGWSIAVNNAHLEVKACADYVTKADGGHGAVREICDMLLVAQGHYEHLRAQYVVTPFRQRCYDKLRQVPKGKVVTYGELARAIGDKNAQRAVGGAMSNNPHAPQVPCHRVIKSDGRVGSYGGGVAAKIARLQQEGVAVIQGKISKDYFFYFDD